MQDKIKNIVFLVIPQATLLDITGPYEVFVQALEFLQSKGRVADFIYELHSVSINKNKKITTFSGMVIQCNENINSIDYDIDTLFIPGVPNSLIEDYKLDSKVLQWIEKQSKITRRICSVCTGSFFLAEAGILSDKKATTHWEKSENLKRNYSNIDVDSNPIFIKDKNVYTSAGISTGMDLALALIEEDFGKSFALDVAKQMVLYLKRPGSQSQYSTILTHQDIDYHPIEVICGWIEDHLNEMITVEILAGQVSMSPRNFARVFVKETGITPAKYIDKLRIETACRYLVDTNLSLKEVAILCGLGSPDNMRKIFFKYLNISPANYRSNFGTAL